MYVADEGVEVKRLGGGRVKVSSLEAGVDRNHGSRLFESRREQRGDLIIL